MIKVIFLLVVYCLLNYYILRRTGSILGYNKAGIVFYILLAVCCFSYIGTSILEHKFGGRITAVFHTISGLWLGFGFLLFSFLMVYEIANLLFKINPQTSRWFLLIPISISLYAIVNANLIRLKTVNVKTPENIKIVQLSDIHLGSVSNRYLNRIINKTNAQKPDLVLITGDLVDSYQRLDKEAIQILNRLSGQVYFVTGNHERYAGLENIFRALEKTKIHVLKNESVRYKDIQLIGINDSPKKGYLQKHLDNIKIDKSAFTVLMYHRPDGLAAASKAGVDLMLSGHTHNGQIVPFNYLVKMRFEKIKGLFHNADCKLHVSTGTGTWGPKMRLGSKNEIVVFEPAR